MNRYLKKCLKIYFIFYLLDFITFKLRKYLKTLSASERHIQSVLLTNIDEHSVLDIK